MSGKIVLPEKVLSYLDSAKLKFQFPSNEFSATWPTVNAKITWEGDINPGSFQVTLDGGDITDKFFISKTGAHATLDLAVGNHTLTVTAKIGIPIGIHGGMVDVYKQLTDTVQFAVQDIPLILDPQKISLTNNVGSNTEDLTVSVDRQAGGFQGDVYIGLGELDPLPPCLSSTPDSIVIKSGQTSGTFTFTVEEGVNIGDVLAISCYVHATAYLPDGRLGSGYHYIYHGYAARFSIKITGIF